MTIAIFKLHCKSAGHPYVQSGALPVGYFGKYFNGKILPKEWIPPEFEIRRFSSKLPDIIAWKEPLPLLSERAVALFRTIAPDCAEYREFTLIRKRPYFVLNVLAVEDILDVGGSKTSRTSDGRIRSIQEYAFSTAEVPSQVFKLPGFLDGPVFVTRQVAQAVVDAGLIGFQFRDPSINETALLFAGREANAFPDA